MAPTWTTFVRLDRCGPRASDLGDDDPGLLRDRRRLRRRRRAAPDSLFRSRAILCPSFLVGEDVYQSFRKPIGAFNYERQGPRNLGRYIRRSRDNCSTRSRTIVAEAEPNDCSLRRKTWTRISRSTPIPKLPTQPRWRIPRFQQLRRIWLHSATTASPWRRMVRRAFLILIIPEGSDI